MVKDSSEALRVGLALPWSLVPKAGVVRKLAVREGHRDRRQHGSLSAACADGRLEGNGAASGDRDANSY